MRGPQEEHVPSPRTGTAVITTAFVAALAATAADAASAHPGGHDGRERCPDHHSDTYCEVEALRREIPRTRAKVVRHARTLLRREPRPARLAWRVRPLERESRYWRRTLPALRRATSVPWSRRIPRWHAFQCIHRHEGPWNARTGNGYYGGLQMDMAFQRTYGRDFLERWGTADRWPPAAQIVVADRAYRSGRGFTPWPNTARACGLL